MFSNFATPAVIAALVAALIACINIFVTFRISRAQSQQQERQSAFENELRRHALVSEEARDAKKALRELARLGEHVRISVRQLLELSPSLDDERMMIATANTLGIVADFFNAADQNFMITAPHDVAEHVRGVQKQLASFFLQLEVRAERRAESSIRLHDSLAGLSVLVERLHTCIRKYVAPPLQIE